MADLDHVPYPRSFPKDRHAPSMPRKTVSRDRLLELIRARVRTRAHHLRDIPPPVIILIQPSDGGTNWKVDQFIGIPGNAINDYMDIVRELMNEYELR